MLRQYYLLTKPGIIYGNLLNATAGFLLASCLLRFMDGGLFVATIAGMALVIAAACVVNNITDRTIDRKMARTETRGTVTGAISVPQALIYAVLLGGIGFAILALRTNVLTSALGVLAVFMYLVPYGIAKRKTVLGTIVGSVPGALPPVAAYCAVTGGIDPAAVLLFFIFALWQMPHFYAIALFRSDEYAAAGLPVLPVRKGIRPAKQQTMAYIGAFLLTNLLLSFYEYMGYTYAVIVSAVSLYWLWRGWRAFHTADSKKWGGMMFGASLMVILALDGMLALGALFP
jgi:heme o synthase